MYKLELMDGTIIDNLERINPSVFRWKGDSSIYFSLTDDNLSCATLYKDNDIDDILVDYTKQNFFWDNGVVQFRLRQKEEEEV